MTVNTELKNKINICYEMCDYIEAHGLVKQPLRSSLKDALKKEFQKMLFLISNLDQKVSKEEACFISLR